MTVKIEGSCFCGQVRYHSPHPPALVFYCHCQDCQKITGGPFSTLVRVARAGFHIDGPVTHFAHRVAERRSHKHFCTTCGSLIMSETERSPDYIYITAGTLDDPTGLEPKMHVFTARQIPWLVVDDDLPKH